MRGRPYAAPPDVYESLWIVVGAILALAATKLWRANNAQSALSAAARPREDAAATTAVETVVSAESHELALSMAEELASLLSALEARAHHLIEAAPSRNKLPAAAEALLSSVHRLRNLHNKLVTFGRARPVERGTTDVVELIGGLGDDLQQMQLGLELRWEPPAVLPRVAANPDAVRDAMLFVCAALLRAERGATRLTFSTERCFASERPTIQIELNLEWTTVPDRSMTTEPVDRAFALEWEAAKHLVSSHSGDLTMSHLPGTAVRAVVRFPIACEATPTGPDEASPIQTGDALDAPPPTELDSDHGYGGALVLEADPALRAVLSRELKASGRAVFACADGESAHTFLQATPDRFELLIIDDAQELEEHTALARTIRSQAPALKICLLTPAPATAPADWEVLHTLRKPFGVHELRRTLASILTTH